MGPSVHFIGYLYWLSSVKVYSYLFCLLMCFAQSSSAAAEELKYVNHLAEECQHSVTELRCVCCENGIVSECIEQIKIIHIL